MQLRYIQSKCNTMNKFQISEGFTLIELLLVIVIIGIMATVGVVNYVGVRERARDAQRKADLQQLRAALELYRADQGSYPPSLPSCDLPLTASGSTYMQKIPCDPESSSGYSYISSDALLLSYALVACLENGNDAGKDNPINPHGTSCSVASYSVTNP